jgi:hypothetical protein
MALEKVAITQEELDAARYGPSTAKAVLTYKTKRNIVNRAYQAQADDIVGIMTIKALDAELLSRQVEEKPTFVCRCPRLCDFTPEGGKTRIVQDLERTAGRTKQSGRPAAAAPRRTRYRALG